MPALAAGTKAPEFSAKTLDGKNFELNEALLRGPVLLAFFKVSCPTCQYTFPFLQRLFEAYKNKGFTLIGVSQNEASDTVTFAKQFGVKFSIVLDDTKRFPVSNAYGLTSVPTLFWISSEREIELTSVGWSRKDFEEINRRMAEIGKQPALPPFQPGEEVRDFRAG
jgi:peroxiredoxin